MLSLESNGVPVKPMRCAVGSKCIRLSAKMPFWVRCASSLITMMSWSGWMGVALGSLNFCMSEKMKEGLPLSLAFRSSPLEAMNFSAFTLPSSPQFSKVSLICLFSSSRSVRMTMVGEPSNLRRIFCDRNTIE